MTPEQMEELLREASVTCDAASIEDGISEMRRKYRKELSARLDRTADLIKQIAKAEPVAWRDPETDDLSRVGRVGWQPLYRAPPARKPLSNEQIEAAFFADSNEGYADFVAGVRFAEQAHGIRSEK